MSEETNSNLELSIVQDQNSRMRHVIGGCPEPSISASTSSPAMHISTRTKWPNENYLSMHREQLWFNNPHRSDDDSDSDSVMLHSFLPLVKKLNEAQKLDFQLYVLQYFRNVMKTNDVPSTKAPVRDIAARPCYPCPNKMPYGYRNSNDYKLYEQQQQQQQKQQQQQQQSQPQYHHQLQYQEQQQLHQLQKHTLAINALRSRRNASPNPMPKNLSSRPNARDPPTPNNSCSIDPQSYFTSLN